MFVSKRPRKFDWNAIRDFYEAGHSARECQERFGISNGAWYSAVQRGDISMRLTGKPKPRGETRRTVRALLAEGTPQAQIAQALGLSKATVCYHARQLGVPPRSVSAPTSDWDEIREYYERGHSAADCQRRFGISVSAWSGAVATGRIQTRPRLEPAPRQSSPAGRWLEGTPLRDLRIVEMAFQADRARAPPHQR
jgi:hypothetical protein